MNEPTPVFILHWNNPDGCARAVREFQKQRVPVKITVLDNGSREENIKRLKHVVGDCIDVVCLEENLGFGSGLNEGLRVWLSEKNGNYVVVSAHDAIPREDCVSRLLKTMEDHPDVGIISPEYDTGIVTRFSGLRGPYLEMTSEPSVEGFEPQAFANGVVMMFRRKCLEEIGIFDKTYFAYGDEVDLCLRAWEHGWKVGFVRGVRVENPGCSVPSGFASYLQIRNSILLVRRWKGGHWAVLRSLLFALNVLRLFLQGPDCPLMFTPRAWLKGIADAWLGKLSVPHANNLNQSRN